MRSTLQPSARDRCAAIGKERADVAVGEGRAPKGVRHRRGAGARSMPYGIGRADRTASVAGGGLQVAIRIGGAVFDLAVGDRVVGAAAGKRDRAVTVAALQGIKEMKEGILVDGLRREGQIAMPVLERRIRTGAAARARPPRPARTASRRPARRHATRRRCPRCDDGSISGSSAKRPSSASDTSFSTSCRHEALP